uniref:Uncharacterized protein n=1 Tax=Electrophorus electricus TaxID=8005 RepID=A0A4W4DMG1_ELEEL
EEQVTLPSVGSATKPSSLTDAAMSVLIAKPSSALGAEAECLCAPTRYTNCVRANHQCSCHTTIASRHGHKFILIQKHKGAVVC